MYSLFLSGTKHVLLVHVITDSNDYENTDFLQKECDDGKEQYCFNFACHLIIILMLKADTNAYIIFIFPSDEPDYVNADTTTS